MSIQIMEVFWTFVLLSHTSALNFHYIKNARQNWFDAKDNCTNMGMELAKFPSELEYDGGVNYIQDMGGTNDVWFGLSSDGTPPYMYKWMDGEPTSWTKWTPDEPNAEASDRCIRLKRNANYGYATRHCSIEYDYLCSFTGSNPIVLTLNDSNVIVSHKTDVIIACSYESTLPVIRIFWSFDNSVTAQETDMGIPGNSGTVIYRIDHAGPDNIGVYQCNVENIFGTERGTVITFSVILDSLNCMEVSSSI
ncbi:uncharacterized protein [Mytilus edulis]|uniref:uncharacterized protein n=1 Tax=Mytilus edulis TaxID=6550 RepID=UPI0039EDFDEC